MGLGISSASRMRIPRPPQNRTTFIVPLLFSVIELACVEAVALLPRVEKMTFSRCVPDGGKFRLHTFNLYA